MTMTPRELELKVRRLEADLRQLGEVITNLPVRLADMTRSQSDFRFFRIASSTQDSDKFRYTYDVVEIEKITAGFDAWTDVDGGITGDAYAMMEDQHGNSGVTADGVDTDGTLYASTTFSPQAIADGTRVLARLIVLSDETQEWQIINVMGAHDGEC